VRVYDEENEIVKANGKTKMRKDWMGKLTRTVYFIYNKV
jgi:hypothetical protein